MRHAIIPFSMAVGLILGESMRTSQFVPSLTMVIGILFGWSLLDHWLHRKDS